MRRSSSSLEGPPRCGCRTCCWWSPEDSTEVLDADTNADELELVSGESGGVESTFWRADTNSGGSGHEKNGLCLLSALALTLDNEMVGRIWFACAPFVAAGLAGSSSRRTRDVARGGPRGANRSEWCAGPPLTKFPIPVSASTANGPEAACGCICTFWFRFRLRANGEEGRMGAARGSEDVAGAGATMRSDSEGDEVLELDVEAVFSANAFSTDTGRMASWRSVIGARDGSSERGGLV